MLQHGSHKLQFLLLSLTTHIGGAERRCRVLRGPAGEGPGIHLAVTGPRRLGGLLTAAAAEVYLSADGRVGRARHTICHQGKTHTKLTYIRKERK